MNDQTVQKAFRPSFGALHRDAQRFLQALNDSTIGPPVVAHLPATFAADFTAQIDSTAQAVVDQSGALGAVRLLTQSQAANRRSLRRRMAAARRAATFAFPGQTALLHDDFQVGVHTPMDFASIVQRARKLLAACAVHAADLAPHGWSPAAQTMFASAIDAAANGTVDQSVAADAKQGLTGRRNLTGNALYNQCRALQSVADMVYPASLAASDATALEARALFLMGEFPSRASANASSTPVPAVAPALAPAPAAQPLAA